MNSNDYSYTLEKLYLALDSLVGIDTIQNRLHDAYISNLAVLTEDDFPEESKEEWNAVDQALTGTKAIGDEGDARASIDALTDEEGAEVAKKIVGLFYEVSQTVED